MNLSNGTEIADSVANADSFFKRLKGLMFTKDLPAGHGLIIQPCQSIHTFFMNYPIDVVYLDGNSIVVGIDEKISPAKIGKVRRKARSVLELPAGTIQNTDLKVGHCLSIK
ncbi:DUF192 domain-containing protein [Neobacillus piezotolerans]|uniref:DUF192 domain-containing protein n=1 Tax=Neobacillus piezotolerans TaxID=2259171 RepID=UPI001FE82FAE|nr:DUF192 domain-containing protein [Neobacillus piezotolerans]